MKWYVSLIFSNFHSKIRDEFWVHNDFLSMAESLPPLAENKTGKELD